MKKTYITKLKIVVITFLIWGLSDQIFAQNLLQNGGFETNTLAPWTAWLPTVGSYSSVVSTNQRSGQYCVQVVGRQTSLEQVITGLTPNTNYIVSGWVKCAQGAVMWLGVKEFGATEKYITANATIYTRYEVSFRTGATNTSVKVYFFRHPTDGNTDLSWGDDFELTLDTRAQCLSQIALSVTSSSIWNVRHVNQPFTVSVTPTISSPIAGLELRCKWVDFFGQSRSPLMNLTFGSSNTITLPATMPQGYYELVFETNNPTACLPQRLSGQKREFGFSVLPNVLSSSVRTLNANSSLGMVHINADDPYICPGYSKVLPFSTPAYYSTANDWLNATNSMKQKGYYETALVTGDTYWRTDDSQPVNNTFLINLKNYLQSFFQAAPTIIYWEFGIEENLSGNFSQPYYWANLTQKLQMARQAASAINPNVKIIYQVANLDINSIRAFFQSNAAQYVDIFSWHPYPWQPYPQAYPMPDIWLYQWLQDIKAIKTQYGFSSMPIWFTEVGTTHHGNPGGTMQYPGGATIKGHTRFEAAVYMAKMHVFALTNEVKKIYWYNYQDRGNDPTHPEDNFGMKDYWGFPKANYSTYHLLTEAIKGNTLVFQNWIRNNVFLAEFRKNAQESYIIAWTATSGQSTTLPLSELSSTLNTSNLISVSATDGSPINIVNTNDITIPDYPVFIKYNSGIVPIELLNFQATPLSNTAQLTWQTASERNASHFDVERSQNGKQFEKIGQVKANGNSAVLRNYEFIHKQPFPVSYYRLRQIDYDGTSTLSNIISVELLKVSKIKIFPNPANSKLTIFSDLDQKYTIIDILDREILRGVILNQQVEIDISELQTGVYFVRTNTESVKFLKK